MVNIKCWCWHLQTSTSTATKDIKISYFVSESFQYENVLLVYIQHIFIIYFMQMIEVQKEMMIYAEILISIWFFLVDIFMAIEDCNSINEFLAGSNSILHVSCSKGRNYSPCWSWMHDSLWSQIWIPWDWRIYWLSVVVLLGRCDHLQRY